MEESRAELFDASALPAGQTRAVALGIEEADMEAFLAGDAAAFARLFRRLSPRVARALIHMSRDPRLAEDLTQVTFLKLYCARAAYRRGTPLGPWVFAIARNALIDHYRRVKRHPDMLTADGQLPELTINDGDGADGCARMKAWIDALPPQQREAVVLLKVEGLSLSEAAALCGTSPAAMKMRVHRAYESLRASLTEGGEP